MKNRDCIIAIMGWLTVIFMLVGTLLCSVEMPVGILLFVLGFSIATLGITFINDK